jgi:ribosomal protein L13E
MGSGAKDIDWGEREQRVWEMLGEGKTTSQIADALGIDYWEASELSIRVFDARRTPNLQAIHEGVERLKNIRFV